MTLKPIAGAVLALALTLTTTACDRWTDPTAPGDVTYEVDVEDCDLDDLAERDPDCGYRATGTARVKPTRGGGYRAPAPAPRQPAPRPPARVGR